MRPNEIMSLLHLLQKNPDQVTKRHLKKIYALLIAMGHYPVCPWCKEHIYNINDFTWDHIVPKCNGGTNDIENLQPMHKHCNNAMKNDCVYQAEYEYDIQSGLEEAIVNVRVTVHKKQEPHKDKKKSRYNNSKRSLRNKSRQR